MYEWELNPKTPTCRVSKNGDVIDTAYEVGGRGYLMADPKQEFDSLQQAVDYISYGPPKHIQSTLMTSLI
jgi:hypothetical protein